VASGEEVRTGYVGNRLTGRQRRRSPLPVPSFVVFDESRVCHEFESGRLSGSMTNDPTITTEIHMVHHVKTPEQRHGMEHDVLEKKHEVQKNDGEEEGAFIATIRTLQY
jgi:hypothetical protein